MKLKDRVAIITGASRGLGYAIAKEFALQGAKLSICARSEKDLNYIEKEMQSLGSKVISSCIDVQFNEQVEMLVDKTIKTFRKIDILINNASVLPAKSEIVSYSIKDWENTININLKGTFLLCRACLKEMIPAKSGCIINISSLAGRRASPFWGAYSVSKFGIEGLSLLLSEEGKSRSIVVYSVDPGALRTQMRRKIFPEENNTKIPLPEEKAKFFVHLALSKREDNINVQLDLREWLKKHPEWIT